MKIAVVFSVILVVAFAGCSPKAAKAVRDESAAPEPTVQSAQVAEVDVSESASRPADVESDKPQAKGRGTTAIEEASAAQRYLFAFFHKADDEQTQQMRRVFQAAMEKLAEKANSIELDVGDPSEKDIVEKYRVSGAPMPLALAIAPNGAITGGFPREFEEQQLVEAIASPGEQATMKSLQEGKLVFVCAQNGSTKGNDEAMKGVDDFKADERFSEFTEVVRLDPASEEENAFMAKLKIETGTEEAVTAFLAPPGAIVSKLNGATNATAFVTALQRATSGGCGPSGCGPSGCGPVR